jgi:hypothetical protein
LNGTTKRLAVIFIRRRKIQQKKSENINDRDGGPQLQGPQLQGPRNSEKKKIT